MRGTKPLMSVVSKVGWHYHHPVTSHSSQCTLSISVQSDLYTLTHEAQSLRHIYM